MAETTIDQLPSLTSTNITDRTKVHLLVDDTQGTAATKQLLLSELDDLWATDNRVVSVYSASHGLTSGEYGKPIGWKSDEKPYVFDNTATTHVPVAVLISVTDTNNIVIAPCGSIVEIAQTLLNSAAVGAMLYWDASAGNYTATDQTDGVDLMQQVCYIGEKEGDATTGICIVLPPARRGIAWCGSSLPAATAPKGLYAVESGDYAGLYICTGSERVLIVEFP